MSNINAAFTVALAWGTFSKASGLSPLAPGQWSKFLATYVGIYATLGSLLRPFRFALAVGATPLYTKVITGVRDALPFRKTRPALNRTLALVLVSLFLNAAGTCGIIAAGCVEDENEDFGCGSERSREKSDSPIPCSRSLIQHNDLVITNVLDLGDRFF